MDTVNKFGFMDDEAETEKVTPYHSHTTNLDDLENVEGFNNNGNKNGIYGFRLNERGMYQRSEINASQESIFDPSTVQPKTLLNVVRQDNQWKLIKKKHDWDINIKIKNNTVSCQGDSLQILRIYNSGKMFGNLVPLKRYKDNAILKRHNGEYFLGAKKIRNIMYSSYEFVTKFPQDKIFLENPPEGSTFYIEGFLLDNMDTPGAILEQLRMGIEGLTTPKPFWIQVTKNKDNFDVKSFPTEVKLDVKEINFNKLRIHHDKYLISRIAFTRTPISKDEIYYL